MPRPITEAQIRRARVRPFDPESDLYDNPTWDVYCEACGHTTKNIYGSKPISCPACGEDDLDGLLIEESK